jgi:hypothetical protein
MDCLMTIRHSGEARPRRDLAARVRVRTLRLGCFALMACPATAHARVRRACLQTRCRLRAAGLAACARRERADAVGHSGRLGRRRRQARQGGSGSARSAGQRACQGRPRGAVPPRPRQRERLLRAVVLAACCFSIIFSPAQTLVACLLRGRAEEREALGCRQRPPMSGAPISSGSPAAAQRPVARPCPPAARQPRAGGGAVHHRRRRRVRRGARSGRCVLGGPRREFCSGPPPGVLRLSPFPTPLPLPATAAAPPGPRPPPRPLPTPLFPTRRRPRRPARCRLWRWRPRATSRYCPTRVGAVSTALRLALWAAWWRTGWWWRQATRSRSRVGRGGPEGWGGQGESTAVGRRGQEDVRPVVLGEA